MRKLCATKGRGVGESGLGVYLDFSDAIHRLGADVMQDRYGNLFDMYQRITGENPYKVPMRIYPAIHYTMGGLWVDYNLMSTIPGLFVIGEANFSDHGANRLGASALMQGLSDGYFMLPYTVGNYLATAKLEKVDHRSCRVREAEQKTGREHRAAAAESRGNRTVDSFHRELGKILWDDCGMSRNAAGLSKRIGQDSRTARGILEQREGAGRRRGDEPGAGKSRPRRGFLRTGRADVHRRAGTQ